MRKAQPHRDDLGLLGNLIAYYSLKVDKLASLKLIKLVYLTELAYCIKNNKRMTAIPYFYWNYGPYSKEIEIAAEKIDGKLINQKDILLRSGYEATVYDPLVVEKKIKLPHDVKTIADSIIKDFGELSSKKIKEYVYSTSPFKETEKWKLINLDCLFSQYSESKKAASARASFVSKLVKRGFTQNI